MIGWDRWRAMAQAQPRWLRVARHRVARGLVLLADVCWPPPAPGPGNGGVSRRGRY